MKSSNIVFQGAKVVGDMPTPANLPDMSRYGNNGTLTNVTWTPVASTRNVLSFTGAGTDSKAVVPNVDSLNPIYFTIILWCNPTTIVGEHHVLDHRGIATPGGYHLRFVDSDIAFILLDSASPPEYQVTASGYGRIGWQMIAATWNGTSQIIYYNGQVANSGTPVVGDITLSSSDFVIGHYANVANHAFTWGGLISPLIMCNYALSAGEIRNLFEAERRWYGV